MSAGLTLWVVYRPASDHIGHFAVRRQFASAGTHGVEGEPVLFGRTLAEVRAQLPPDLYPLGRQPDDDPSIVEVWI